MKFFDKYRVDINKLLEELKGSNSEKRVSPPQDFVSKVMKSLDETSKNSRNIMVRFLAFTLLIIVTIFALVIMRNRAIDKSEDE
jgi:hypothetical protein